MTAIDRTAYPRSGERLTREELERRYGLSEADLVFIRGKARGASGRLTLAALLKARQDLGFFPAPDDLHSETIAHLAAQLGLVDPPYGESGYDASNMPDDDVLAAIITAAGAYRSQKAEETVGS